MNFKPFASTLLTGVLALSSALLFEGCAKKVAAVKPAQAPAPVAQTAPAPVTAERPAPAAPAIVAETNRPDTSGRATPDQATKDKIQALLDRIQSPTHRRLCAGTLMGIRTLPIRRRCRFFSTCTRPIWRPSRWRSVGSSSLRPTLGQGRNGPLP